MADDDDGDNDDVEPSSISFHAAFARRRLHWLKDGVWACEGRQGWDAATAEPAEASDSLFWLRTFDGRRPPLFKWFVGGLTSAAFNECDRHVLDGRGALPALIHTAAASPAADHNDGDYDNKETVRRCSYASLLRGSTLARTLRPRGAV